MPLAHDARKPMFDLKSGDGALGSTHRGAGRAARLALPSVLHRQP
jgi:hypothetical protein